MSDYRRQELPSRIVTFDIETVSLTDDPQGAFNAMDGRIVCICMLVDNAVELTPLAIADQDERKLLARFWASVSGSDLLVGHNIADFDIAFIRQRSWILGVEPSFKVNLRKYTEEFIFDIMSIWTNWSYKMKGAGLDNIAKALGIPGKSGHGSEVAELWRTGQFVKLLDYCMNDVWVAYQCFCRMNYRRILPLQLPGIPLPALLPGDTRELVPLPQKRAEAVVAASAPATVQSSFPEGNVAPNGNGKKRYPPRISFLRMGGALVLQGTGTFNLKDSLPGLGGRRSKEKNAQGEEKWIWQVPESNFDKLAGLCVASGISLKPADGTLSVQR